MVYIRDLSWYCTLCGFGHMYDDIYLLLYYHTENFHSLKNSPCSTYSSLSTPEPLASTDLYVISVVVPFLEYYIVGS